MALDAQGCQEGPAGDGRCPLCRTELSAHDVVAAPVAAAALALVPGGDHWDPTDPTSPRRLVSTSPRRQLAVDSPRRSSAADDTLVLADEDAGKEQEHGGFEETSSGVGWSTKLQAIVDELDLVNREHPGEKVGCACWRVLCLAIAALVSSLCVVLVCRRAASSGTLLHSSLQLQGLLFGHVAVWSWCAPYSVRIAGGDFLAVHILPRYHASGAHSTGASARGTWRQDRAAGWQYDTCQALPRHLLFYRRRRCK